MVLPSFTTTSRLPVIGSKPGRLLSVAGLIAVMFTTAACSHGRSVPVSSECADTVTVVFAGEPDETWDPPVEVPPEGTSLGVSSEVDRVWYESADGDVLNEVSLTAEELADSDVDFPTLVVKAEHCDLVGG